MKSVYFKISVFTICACLFGFQKSKAQVKEMLFNVEDKKIITKKNNINKQLKKVIEKKQDNLTNVYTKFELPNAKNKSSVNLINAAPDTTEFQIPVIVHVLNEYNANDTVFNYIPDWLIESQIKVLNDAFNYKGKIKKDSLNILVKKDSLNIVKNIFTNFIPPAYDSLVGKPKIKFVLAQRDSLDNKLNTPGIDRFDARDLNIFNSNSSKNVTYVSINNFINTILHDGYTQSYVDSFIKPRTIWNPSKYFNIWVLKLDDKLIGFTKMPSGSGLSGIPTILIGNRKNDGVVLDYRVCGDRRGLAFFPQINPLNEDYYNKFRMGRTAIHEVGHWLGLRNIGGDDFGTCLNDDFCNDTPLQEEQNFSKLSFPNRPRYPKFSCSNYIPNFPNEGGDMFMNYMDNGKDSTLCMFTRDQVIRMRTVLQNATLRSSVADSITNLVGDSITSAPVKPTANFTMELDSIYVAETMEIKSISTNSPTTYKWIIIPSSTNIFIPKSNFKQAKLIVGPNTTPGIYKIGLIATNAVGSDTAFKNLIVLQSSFECDSIANYTPTTPLGRLTISGVVGYPTGQNQYYDTDKAERFIIPKKFQYGIKITGMLINPSISKGTGFTKFNIYSNNALYDIPDSISTFQSIANNTISVGVPNTILFTNTVGNDSIFIKEKNKPFFLGYSLAYAPGDTFVMESTNIKSAIENTAYEKTAGPSGQWYAFPNSWSFGLTLGLRPIYCPTIFTTQKEIETALINNVITYPNPSTGIFTTSLVFKKETNVSLEIRNILGQIILKEELLNIKNKDYLLDLSAHQKGIYLLHVKTNNGATTQKIVLE